VEKKNGVGDFEKTILKYELCIKVSMAVYTSMKNRVILNYKTIQIQNSSLGNKCHYICSRITIKDRMEHHTCTLKYSYNLSIKNT